MKNVKDGLGEVLLRDQAPFVADGVDGEGRLVFRLDHEPRTSGFQTLRIRAYPYHALLAHRFELGCMVWL
ncbi:hypothetical protein A9R16_010510 [Acidiferrobacter thiooxydans]|uniref:hypothetical protein n=1 Tax=Acidiferrobacter thiooxydans TaxID=163359 RepID=UPI001E2BAAA8|nr:hypothetical protein [Acidiferrobacter thiooxydans]UEN98863.1 hypothetical protein A9R16_010510 [Acidiferrobacter thiooxydans]